jgi:hypothetical protein
MTATISYNPRNRAARLAMDYIQSLGVFVINPLPTRSRIKVSNGDVNEQLMNDLKGALREVKDSMDGKIQMKNAYELLNEL